MNDCLFTPAEADIRRAEITAFAAAVGCDSYGALHLWAVANPERFWSALWDFLAPVAAKKGERILIDGGDFIRARFFPDAELNYAENLLAGGGDGEIALIVRGENKPRKVVTYGALRAQTAALAAALTERGVVPGDRVAAVLPNGAEAIVAMLAASAVGATFSSCSPDFGADGIAERFGQIAPKVLFAADGYFYNGRRFDIRDKIAAALDRIPAVGQVVAVNYAGQGGGGGREALDFERLTSAPAPRPTAFARFNFNHPLFIAYSSGTTGRPKCIVHSAGGVLLEHLKELRLHVGLRRGERIFYFTTCGWMMWNWQASALAAGATLVLYDGSPLPPGGDAALLDLAEEEEVAVFGVSARYLAELERRGVAARRPAKLGAVLSTGSPLAAHSYDYVGRTLGGGVRVQSISGGTDILGCFVIGNPALPIYRGEIQCVSLGMDVAVFDERGRPVVGQKGELVCRAPMPSKPLGFWNDSGGEKFAAAYFSRFPGVWTHGDFAELRPRRFGGGGEYFGAVIYGRSDATLNPGGVRIGTAEIYRQLAGFAAIEEALATTEPVDGDERIVLFVKLAAGAALDDDLAGAIRERIRRGASPRHVPARIVAAPDLPRTINGKLAEIAARRALHGEAAQNLAALANPESLAFFSARAKKPLQ